MKTFSSLTFLLLFLAAPVLGAPQAYKLQTEKSKVDFIWFLGSDEVRGTMPVANAAIVLDLDRLGNSDVRVAVDVRGARAGFPFASQGMKSKKVLWAKKYPQIVFESTRFRRDGSNALVDGLLTVRGSTQPATFKAELFRQAGTEPGDRRRLSVKLTGTLSRSEFGAVGWADLAGDEIKISIIARMQIEQPS